MSVYHGPSMLDQATPSQISFGLIDFGLAGSSECGRITLGGWSTTGSIQAVDSGLWGTSGWRNVGAAGDTWLVALRAKAEATTATTEDGRYWGASSWLLFSQGLHALDADQAFGLHVLRPTYAFLFLVPGVAV